VLDASAARSVDEPRWIKQASRYLRRVSAFAAMKNSVFAWFVLSTRRRAGRKKKNVSRRSGTRLRVFLSTRREDGGESNKTEKELKKNALPLYKEFTPDLFKNKLLYFLIENSSNGKG